MKTPPNFKIGHQLLGLRAVQVTIEDKVQRYVGYIAEMEPYDVDVTKITVRQSGPGGKEFVYGVCAQEQVEIYMGKTLEVKIDDYPEGYSDAVQKMEKLIGQECLFTTTWKRGATLTHRSRLVYVKRADTGRNVLYDTVSGEGAGRNDHFWPIDNTEVDMSGDVPHIIFSPRTNQQGRGQRPMSDDRQRKCEQCGKGYTKPTEEEYNAAEWESDTLAQRWGHCSNSCKSRTSKKGPKSAAATRSREKWLANLQPGDKVVFVSYSYSGRRHNYRFQIVERLTKTQFVLDNGKRYRRKDGSRIGSPWASAASPIQEPTEEIMAAAKEQMRRNEAMSELSAIEYRLGKFTTEALEAMAKLSKEQREAEAKQ